MYAYNLLPCSIAFGDEKEYNIEHESTIHEEMRLCGGPCTNCNKCPCECKKGGYELCSQVVQIMYKFWDM